MRKLLILVMQQLQKKIQILQMFFQLLLQTQVMSGFLIQGPLIICLLIGIGSVPTKLWMVGKFSWETT